MAPANLVPAGARPWLVAATVASALVLAWAARVLPWRPAAPLALLLWGLAALHSWAAVSLAWRPERAARPLQLLALGSLGAAPVFVYAVVSTSVQMVRMFGALGWGLTAALAAIGWLALLATLPVGLYLLRVTRRRHERS